MLGYAHDTAHEKIIRGLALGLAMTMYGRENEADALVTQLLHDKDPILRYGAMYTIAFAYACTGSNAALKAAKYSLSAALSLAFGAGETEKMVEVKILEHLRERDQEKAEFMRRVAANPFDAEAQGKIEEIIREENVAANYENAMEHKSWKPRIMECGTEA